LIILRPNYLYGQKIVLPTYMGRNSVAYLNGQKSVAYLYGQK